MRINLEDEFMDMSNESNDQSKKTNGMYCLFVQKGLLLLFEIVLKFRKEIHLKVNLF